MRLVEEMYERACENLWKTRVEEIVEGTCGRDVLFRRLERTCGTDVWTRCVIVKSERNA